MAIYDYECRRRHRKTIVCSVEQYKREVPCRSCADGTVMVRTLSPVPTNFRHADRVANKRERK